MKQIAKFEKVSFEQFEKDFYKIFSNKSCTPSDVKEIYDRIKLPKRATTGSAGYDFFLPINIFMLPKETYTIPTGIRVKIDDGWVLKLYPRSGLGFKHRMQLDNTVGIIDSDYYYSDNEGHIMAKITNDSYENNNAISLDVGKGFIQGIFCEYGITIDDDADGVRNGGFGSTTK